MKKRLVIGIISLLVIGFLLAHPFVDVLSKPDQIKLVSQLKNGCLIYSLEFKMALEAKEKLQPYLWTRTLAIRFVDGSGHAVTVFVYKNITFVYDPNIGSFIAAMYPLYEPMEIAEIAFPRIPIKAAVFIEPTLTLTYPFRTLSYPEF